MERTLRSHNYNCLDLTWCAHLRITLLLWWSTSGRRRVILLSPLYTISWQPLSSNTRASISGLSRRQKATVGSIWNIIFQTVSRKFKYQRISALVNWYQLFLKFSSNKIVLSFPYQFNYHSHFNFALSLAHHHFSSFSSISSSSSFHIRFICNPLSCPICHVLKCLMIAFS